MTDLQQGPTSVQDPAQTCSKCGAALAADQRYCLHCGTRRGPPRAPAAPQAAPPTRATEQVSVRSEPRQSDFSPLAAVLGIALLGGMLLIGVLIGRGESDEPQQAPVVQLEDGSTTTPQATTPGGSGETAEPASEIVSEWPAGTEGFTVRLSSIPKQGASAEEVERLKADAESKGASEVGILDSDLYTSLRSGEWVVYSGVDSERGDATESLNAIQSDFPKASVVEVSSTAPSSSEAEPPTPTEDQTSSAGGA